MRNTDLAGALAQGTGPQGTAAIRDEVEGILFQHPDGSIQGSNAVAEQLLGYPGEQLRGLTLVGGPWQVVHADGTPCTEASDPVIVVCQTGQPCLGVILGIGQDPGSLTWVQLNAHPLVQGSPVPGAIVTTLRPVAAPQIQGPGGEGVLDSPPSEPYRREQRVQRVLDSLFSFVGLLHLDGTLIEANRRALEAAALRPEDVLGQPFEDTYWWAYDPQIQAQLRQAIDRAAQGETVRYDVPVRIGPAHQIMLDFALVPLLDAMGQVEYLVPSGIDISDRKRIEQELWAANQRITDILESMTDAFYTLDRAWRFTYVNREAEQILGKSRESLIGRVFWEEFPPALDTVVYTEYQRAMADDTTVIFEVYYPPFDEWYEISAYPSEQGLGVYFRTITERKRIEAERQQSAIALQQSQALLQQQLAEIEVIYQSAPIGLNVIDANLRFVRINQKLAEMNGFPIEAHIGRSIRELLPDLADVAEQILRPILETGEPLMNVEISGTTPAQPGVQRFWLEHFLPLKDGDRVIGISTVCEEITERKRDEARRQQTEDMLRQTNDRLDMALKSAPITLFNQDQQLHYTWIYNPRHGSAVDSLGKHDSDLVPPDAAALLTALKRQVLDTGVGLRQEIKLALEGSDYYYDLTLEPIRNGPEAIVGITGAAMDVTARKQTEEALWESKERFRNLADNIAQFAWMADEQGWLFWYNQRWFDYTGTTLEEMQGWAWQTVHHPDHVDRVVEKFRHCITTGEAWEDTFPLRSKEGEYRWFLSRAIPIRDEQGRVLRWFGTNTDISDRQQTEEALRQSEARLRRQTEQLAQANRIKDEFLAILSHELRTPLNPILGWARLLQSGRFVADRQQQALQTIERNAQLLVQLIDDLLDISRVIRGKLSLSLSPVALQQPIQAAVETVQQAAIAKSLHLQVDLDPTVGQVSGDMAKLQQVVWNLLSNAIKFTPEGGRITVQLTQCDRKAELRVADTGKGIAADFLPHIFEMFRQQDSSTTRQFGGLGLGLALSWQIVQAHGGTIEASSAGEGQGAIFTVRLPLLPVPSPRAVPACRPNATARVEGVRLLVVDDDLDTLEFMGVFLESQGAQVTTATSALEALNVLTQSPIDVLISDIQIPQMDGYAFIGQVRTLAHLQQLPAIALTAYAYETDRERILAAGYQRHLAKPIDSDALLGAIAELATP